MDDTTTVHYTTVRQFGDRVMLPDIPELADRVFKAPASMATRMSGEHTYHFNVSYDPFADTVILHVPSLLISDETIADVERVAREMAEDRTPAAWELPDGSVVATAKLVWIKNHPNTWTQWRCTNGGTYSDVLVQDEIYQGAVVLRVGYPAEPVNQKK